jgi:phosphoribosyl 1,2-cyclic phosphate phosphodiesterase
VTQVIMLGSGTSQGIPVIGCHCPVCTSDDPRNRRTRASVYLRLGTRLDARGVVIDTATEFRLQCVANGIERLDAVLFTHSHADHVHGLDDVRQFSAAAPEHGVHDEGGGFVQATQSAAAPGRVLHDEAEGFVQATQSAARVPCYGSPETMQYLARKFDYFFCETQAGGGKPNVEFIEVEAPFELFGREIIPLPVKHGELSIYGYRIGRFAYITDASHIPSETMAKLDGLDTLILNALRREPHPTHLSLDEAVAIIEQLRPARAFLTHLTHRLDHAATEAELPPSIRLGYDGLTIDVPD